MIRQKLQNLYDLTLRHKKLTALIFFAFTLVSLASVSLLRTQLPLSLDYKNSDHRIDKAFEVDFGQDLASIEDIGIYPEVEGAWTVKRSILGVSGIKFEPSANFQTNISYTVSVNKASRLVTGEEVNVPDINFTTEQAPSIYYFSVDDYNDKSIPADHSFKVELSAQNRSLSDLKFVTKPFVELEGYKQGDSVFVWKPKKILPQGKKLDISLTDEKSGEVLLDKQAKVAEEPAIDRPVKRHNFGKNDKAVITFKEPVDTTTAKIIFNLDGSGQWKDDRTYSFKPKKVEVAKTYKYTIKAGLRTAPGGILRNDQKLKFSTPGVIEAIAMSPRGSELSQAAQEIRFTFNQPVVKKTAENRFGVSAGKLKSFRWEGNTLITSVVDLGYQRTVTAELDPGIKPVFGLPSIARQTFSFTTEVRVKKLDVAYYAQVFAQSCEAANVRMALNYRGINSTDWAILQKFGYDPKSRDKKKNIWDDPQKQFVGNVHGSQTDGTGWGVYNEPVAKAIRSFGRSATIHHRPSTSFIASQIHKDRPVIVWGIWGSNAKIDSWKTSEGKKIKGPIPMHVRLAVGVRGEPNAPLGFYIHDPITGPTYWSSAQLAANMAAAGPAHQAVVVY